MGGEFGGEYSVAHSCPTLCDSMYCSPSGPFVHGILQERILEWVAIPSSRGFPDPGMETESPALSPALAGRFFTAEPPGKLLMENGYMYMYG